MSFDSDVMRLAILLSGMLIIMNCKNRLQSISVRVLNAQAGCLRIDEECSVST
jgi:hypothetical protein